MALTDFAKRRIRHTIGSTAGDDLITVIDAGGGTLDGISRLKLQGFSGLGKQFADLVDAGGPIPEHMLRDISFCFREQRVADEIDALLLGVEEITLPDPIAKWRADSYTGTSPTITLTDLTGNGHDLLQSAGTATPGTGGVVTQDKLAFVNARLDASGDDITGRPITVVVVWTRTGAGSTTGFVGAAGASAINSFWFGVESADRLNVYTGDGGSQGTGHLTTIASGFTNPEVFMAVQSYEGFGTFFKGVLQTPTASSIAKGQTPDWKPSIGTDYRTAGGDFYEARIYDRVLTQTEQDLLLDELVTRYGVSVTKWSDLTAVPTLIQMGDSVSAGREVNTNLAAEYTGDITGCEVYNGTAWATLNASATNNNQLGESPGTDHGPEVAYAKEYIDLHSPALTYLFKYGTSSCRAFDIGTTATGFPDATAAASQGETAAKELWEAMRAAVAAGNRMDIKGVLFCYGSNDAIAEASVLGFQAAMDKIKTEWTRGAMADSPPVFLLEMKTTATDTWNVLGEQAAWATANGTLISGTFTALDTLHPDADGNVTIGTTAAGLADAP